MAVVTQPKLPPVTPPNIISDSDTTGSFADVRNGIIEAVYDAPQKYKGKYLLPMYASKTEGYTVLDVIKDNGEAIKSGVRGGVMWVNHDETADNRFHLLFAIKNKIYLKDGSDVVELYDVEDKDGYTIKKLIGAQAKNNVYLCIGDKNMDAELYKYIGYVSKKGTTSDGGGGTVTNILTVQHGLITGMTVVVDSTGYEVTVVDDDNFKITKAYSSSETVSWTATKQFVKATMAGMRAASRIIFWNNRLAVTGCAENKSAAQFSETNIFGNFKVFTVGMETTDGGDFYGNLGGVNCMKEHDGYACLLEAQKITFHKEKDAIVSGGAYVRNPDTLEDKLTVSGTGTTSPFGAVSARGKLFYLDGVSGVFALDVRRTIAGYSNGNENLMETWKKEFKNYDASDGFIEYDNERDLLLVGVASIAGGIIDTVLIYSFSSRRWSVMDGKRANQLIVSSEESKIYGFGSLEPEVHHFFDGSFNDAGKDQEFSAWTQYFDGGRRTMYKEFDSYNVIMGISGGTEFVKIETINDANNTLSSVEIDVTD